MWSMCAYTEIRRMCVLSVRHDGAGVTFGVLLYPGAVRGRRSSVVSVPGAAVRCHWSAVSVLGCRRCSSPMWWSVRVLVAALVLLMVVVVMQLLVLVYAVVVDAVACVVVVAVTMVRWC